MQAEVNQVAYAATSASRGSTSSVEDSAGTSAEAQAPSKLADLCLSQLKQFPGKYSVKNLEKICAEVELLKTCESVRKTSIYHYSKLSKMKAAKRILVFSLIHGDETSAGTVSRYWMERLNVMDPRNSWRVIPVLNPDGVHDKTRTNANHIDLNRNFPTRDWEKDAITFWKRTTSSNPRRFPGSEAGSEPETKCALDQIEDFKPDFIVSIHTPLQVLDFDGPKVKPPKYDYLPWKSLGHFPGSLGRYMWFERQVPVLTTELREDLPRSQGPFERLQDVIGTLVKMEMPATTVK